MVQDAGRGVADVEKDAEQRAVLRVRTYAFAQGLSIFEWSKRPIDPADYFAQGDCLWRPFELVAAVCPAQADDNPRALQLQEDRLEELLWQVLLRGDVFDFDDVRRMLCQHRQGLQSVKSSLRDSHKAH